MSFFQAFRIAQHEWKLILKEPRFLVPFLITPLVLIGIQAFATYFRPLGSDSETLLMARSLLLMLAILAPSAAVPLGADSFAGEKERNTFEILLCLPVPLGSLFWGKVLGIFPLPVLMGWLGQCALLLILNSRGLLYAGFVDDALKAITITPFLGLLLSAFSVLMSLVADSVRGAAQLTSLVMLAIFFGTLFLANEIFSSIIIYLVFMGILFMGSVTCLLVARSRFAKLH